MEDNIYTNILNMNSNELIKYLFETYIENIPCSIETVEDLNNAGYLLSQLTNKYAYVESMAIYTKNAVREEKRKGPENKSNYEDMIDRRDTLQEVAKILNMQYQAVSRMITVKQEVNKELNMNSGN